MKASKLRFLRRCPYCDRLVTFRVSPNASRLFFDKYTCSSCLKEVKVFIEPTVEKLEESKNG